MIRIPFSLALSLSLGCGLALPPAAAQQPPAVVSPRGAATGLGNRQNRIPFSWIPTAYQQVHHRDSFSSRAPRTITVLRLRMARNQANQPGNTVDLELHMAASPNDNVAASPVFAHNVVPGTEVAVFARKVVSLPTVPDNSWAIAFPFDVPFAFTGSTHSSWRALVFGNGNGNRDFDYPLDMWANDGASTDNGPPTGCASATGTGPAVHTAALLHPGGESVFEAHAHVGGGLPAVLGIGISSTSWGGVPLPFDLTPLGARGCFLRNDFALTLAGTTQPYPNGTVVIRVKVPADPRFADATFYSQFAFLQAGANTLGLFTSNGLRHTLGRDHGVARIVHAGNPVATSGGVAPHAALAIGLD